MKHNVNLIFSTLFICLLICGCRSSKEKKENEEVPKDEYVEAKIKGYNSIDELEDDSDLIVIGKKTGEIDSGIKYNNGMYEYAYTYSTFEITETIKNKVNENKKEIIIFENQAYDENKNQILHIAGYIKMIEENIYILYLKDTEYNHYVPLSAVIGKVPLNSSEIDAGSSLLKNGDNNGENVIEKLHKSIQEKYRDKVYRIVL